MYSWKYWIIMPKSMMINAKHTHTCFHLWISRTSNHGRVLVSFHGSFLLAQPPHRTFCPVAVSQIVWFHLYRHIPGICILTVSINRLIRARSSSWENLLADVGNISYESIHLSVNIYEYIPPISPYRKYTSHSLMAIRKLYLTLYYKYVYTYLVCPVNIANQS